MTRLAANEKEPGSFRDPSGFLFHRSGTLYRQVNHCFKEDFDTLLTSGLYQKLTENKLLIPHTEAGLEKAFSGEAYKVLCPERIPFISYPYEWSFSQLQDAALLTLQILKTALDHGMVLKDASAYNVQFLGCRPVFIDTLSFEKYQEGKPWTAYRQFCQHFLAPLALASLKNISLQQMLRLHLDGIPLDLAAALLPWSSKFSLSLAIHIHLHARSQKSYADKAVKPQQALRFSRTSFLGMIDNLEQAVKKLRWKAGGTEWADYYDATNYSAQGKDHKRDLAGEYLNLCRPASVWDLGANTGVFSRLASSAKIPTAAFDIDPAAVERNYLEGRKNSDEFILPLIMDLTNPSPAQGWAHQERMSLRGRGPADAVLALALIHHLAISNNLPLAQIAEYFAALGRNLIIEFVPKNDSQVQKLLSSREDIFPHYTQQDFETAFGTFFSIEKSAKIENSERTLYLLKNRAS